MSKSQSDWYWLEWYPKSSVPSLTVYASEQAEVKTGLLDANGRPLVRRAETEPLGYFPLRESR